MRSDLPAIDAMLDQGICAVRDLKKHFACEDIDALLNILVAKFPGSGSMIAAGFHLGMLAILRSDAEIEEMDDLGNGEVPRE